MSSPVAQRWKARQDPRLLAAFGRVFCEHRGGPEHSCATDADRALIAQWVERTVMRGRVSVDRWRADGSMRDPWRMGGATTEAFEVHEPVPLGEPVIRVRTLPPRPEPTGPCWFPFCERGARHGGQHSGITKAGNRLVELEKALADGRLRWAS